jgi:hypothetical protein
MVVDLVAICDLGALAEFSATIKYYPPSNFRIILITLGDGANFGVGKEHFLEDDLPQLMGWPDVTMLTCCGWMGDMCHLKIG